MGTFLLTQPVLSPQRPTYRFNAIICFIADTYTITVTPSISIITATLFVKIVTKIIFVIVGTFQWPLPTITTAKQQKPPSPPFS